MNPARRLHGVRLVATDADFAAGEGRDVRMPIRDVVMTRPAASSPDMAETVQQLLRERIGDTAPAVSTATGRGRGPNISTTPPGRPRH